MLIRCSFKSHHCHTGISYLSACFDSVLVTRSPSSQNGIVIWKSRILLHSPAPRTWENTPRTHSQPQDNHRQPNFRRYNTHQSASWPSQHNNQSTKKYFFPHGKPGSRRSQNVSKFWEPKRHGFANLLSPTWQSASLKLRIRKWFPLIVKNQFRQTGTS